MDIVVKLKTPKQETYEEKYFQSIVSAKQYTFDIVDVFLVNTRAIGSARRLCWAKDLSCYGPGIDYSSVRGPKCPGSYIAFKL